MIDLSHPIRSGMTVYPGDPEVTLFDALTLEREGVRVTGFNMGSHSGTHLDAPSHTVVGGRTLEHILLEELVGDALVMRVPDPRMGQAIGEHELGLAKLRSVPKIVVIHTGWDQYFGSEKYFNHPFLTGSAAEQLCEMGMHLLAIDTLSPDRTPAAGEQSDFPVHRAVLGSDRLIVENLCGLEAAPDRVRIGFFPLKLGAVDGAPVRAIAFASARENACGPTPR